MRGLLDRLAWAPPVRPVLFLPLRFHRPTPQGLHSAATAYGGNTEKQAASSL